jgi:hypothetical protein
MHALIYSSRAAAGTDRDALRDILAASRSRNAEVGVTGCLLYSGTAFLQVLEGDEDAVRATFARIRRDPRHTDVRVLVDEETPDRAHGDWSMGFAHLGEDEVPGAEDAAAALVDGEAARSLLQRCGARADAGHADA